MIKLNEMRQTKSRRTNNFGLSCLFNELALVICAQCMLFYTSMSLNWTSFAISLEWHRITRFFKLCQHATDIVIDGFELHSSLVSPFLCQFSYIRLSYLFHQYSRQSSEIRIHLCNSFDFIKYERKVRKNNIALFHKMSSRFITNLNWNTITTEALLFEFISIFKNFLRIAQHKYLCEMAQVWLTMFKEQIGIWDKRWRTTAIWWHEFRKTNENFPFVRIIIQNLMEKNNKKIITFRCNFTYAFNSAKFIPLANEDFFLRHNDKRKQMKESNKNKTSLTSLRN